MSEHKEMEVVRHEPQSVDVRRDDPQDLLRLAVEKGADVGTLERLMAVRRELNAERAKAQFDAAMSAFQSEAPIILKKKAGAKNAYLYAPLDAVVAETKDLIRKHGFSYSISSVIEPGWVKAVVTVKHSGHQEVSEFKAPIDNKNPMQTDPQRYGGAMTFAKRYAFCNAFGILTADEDLDAASRPKPPGPSKLAPTEVSVRELAKQLWATLGDICKGDKDWSRANRWLIDECILTPEEAAPDISADRYRQVIAKAKQKLSQP